MANEKLDVRAEIGRRNWNAVEQFVDETNERLARLSAETARLEMRLTGAISQLQGLMQEVQALKAARVGAGPTEHKA